MRTTEDFSKGMVVRTVTGDYGQVDRVDREENTVWVQMSVSGDVVPVAPRELEPMETIG